MDIKKIFINCMIVLCIGVVAVSVVTAIKRSNEPREEVIVSQDVIENEEIILDTETMESTEEDIVEEETVATKTLYTTSKVNVRTGPGTNYEKVVELRARTEVVAVGELDENGWQMIEYEGQEAYILGRYLSETVPEVETQSVGNQTNNTPQVQNIQQEELSAQSQPVVSEPIWYFPVGNIEEQTTTSQDTTIETTPESTPAESETTPAESETTPTVPETTPAESETTPTVPETTPAESETTPVVPETMPATPETTPVISEQTQEVPGV